MSENINYELERMIKKMQKVAREKYFDNEKREKRKLRIKEKRLPLSQSKCKEEDEY